MDQYQLIQQLTQYQQMQQLQQLQQFQQYQTLIACQLASASPMPMFINQLSMLQSSQRTISQRHIPQIDNQVRKTQSERILPKCVKKEEHSILAKYSQEEISNQLKFLLTHFSKCEKMEISREIIDQVPVIIHNNQILIEIDENLPRVILDRYTGQKKTKEEQIKFILRKCFKFLKQQMNLNELTMSAYEIEKQFYAQFFSGQGDIEEMIPFRQKSANKTMNTQYLKRIFNSQKFYDGYLQYLEHFDQIWDEENEEKIQNMVKQIMKFILSGQVERVVTYKRVPWILSMKRRCLELAQSFKCYSQFNNSTVQQQQQLHSLMKSQDEKIDDLEEIVKKAKVDHIEEDDQVVKQENKEDA